MCDFPTSADISYIKSLPCEEILELLFATNEELSELCYMLYECYTVQERNNVIDSIEEMKVWKRLYSDQIARKS